jgi:Flp pilus assembly pilin Flp
MEQRSESVERMNGELGLVARGRQAAQGLVEYGLTIGVVGVLAIAALQRWGTDIGNLLDRLGRLIQPVGGG